MITLQKSISAVLRIIGLHMSFVSGVGFFADESGRLFPEVDDSAGQDFMG